jgi:uncharacterized membrane protein
VLATTLGAGLDRRVTRLIIRRLRREWPALRFVPAALLSPLVAPAAVRVRRSALRAGAAALLVAVAAVALLALV